MASKANRTYTITASVIGLQTGGTNRAHYTVKCIASAAGGVLTLHTAAPVTTEYESNAAWNCTVDAPASAVRIRVTGAAATTVNWGVYDLVVAVSG